MSFDPNRAIQDPEVRALIRWKAWQLWDRWRLPTWDLDDINEELTAELLRRLYRYVPSRARLLAFVVPTLNRLAANLSRKLRAEGRRQRRQARLDPEYLDQVGPQRSALRCDNDLLDLIRDVQGCIRNLPSELRPLAMLLRTLSKSDAASVLGFPRTSLYPALRRIRLRFEERDLGEYLA